METPLVIIVDALDECGSDISRSHVLDCLYQASQLCRMLRVIVTSRPYADISSWFTTSKADGCLTQPLISDDKNTYEDILTFTKKCFSGIVASTVYAKNLNQTLEQLAQLAGGLFIWVQTAFEFVSRQYDIEGSLKTLLSEESPAEAMDQLYKLYETILSECVRKGESNVKVFHQILGLIVSVRTPLPLKGLDYLTNQNKCLLYFYINRQDKNSEIAYKCLNIMADKLKFNICNLESSYVLNKDLDNLDEKIHRNISIDLQYSCFYWASHLYDSSAEKLNVAAVLAQLEKFLFGCHLIFWLEVLSLLNHLDISIQALSILLQDNQINHMLAEKGQNLNHSYAQAVADAYRFVRAFFEVISLSTPHLYISALPFAPSGSLVARNLKYFVNTMVVTKRHKKQWSPCVLVMSRHTYGVRSVAFSPDGQTIASGSADNTVRIWNASTGAPIGEPLCGHTGGVTSVAFSPDGKYIVSGSSDVTLRIWNIQTYTTVSICKGHSREVSSVAYSSNGHFIASGSNDCTVRMWNATTGELIGRPIEHGDYVKSVVFSSDGQYIVLGSLDKPLRIWNIQSGIEKCLEEYTNCYSSIAFSPDNTKIAAGSYNAAICIWDMQTCKMIGKPLIGHTDSVTSVAFSPNGVWLVSGSSDKTVKIWNVKNGKSVGKSFQGHTDRVWSVAFSPDSHWIVSGSDDRTVCIWDATMFDHKKNKIWSKLFPSVSGQKISQHPAAHMKKILSVAFSPCNNYIVSGSADKSVRIWNAETGASVGKPFEGHTDLVSSVAFSPDGNKIISGSHDKTLCIWNAKTYSIIKQLKGHTDRITSVAFSPNGEYIASGSFDRTVHIWHASTSEPAKKPFQGHTSRVTSVAFSYDSQLIASGSYDTTICIWNVQTGEIVGIPLRGRDNWITSVAFSPDSSKIISGSTDYTVCMWDVQTGAQIGSSLHHKGGVTSVAFSPDGNWIASGSYHQTVCIWNAHSGAAVGKPLEDHNSVVSSVVFSPDGKTLVSGSYDHSILVWSIQ
ncbi:WD40 repeat-like protein, partial [Rickenella mellea]